MKDDMEYGAIMVHVSTLFARVWQMLQDGCTIVVVSIAGALNDKDPEMKCPPSLSFEATDGYGCGAVYEDIDAVKGSYTYPENENMDDDDMEYTDIVVHVSTLFARVWQMLLDGRTVVEISITGAQNDKDPEMRCPPLLSFDTTDDLGLGVEYASIEAVEGSYTYPDSEE